MTSLERIYTRIYAKKNAFFMAFFVVATLTYAVLYTLDFYPEPPADATETDDAEEVSSLPTTPKELTTPEQTISQIAATGDGTTTSVKHLPKVAALPNRIVIPESETDVVVLNPESLDMNDLDTALLDGVVRHPQSAHFGDPGNILIFGHSSYLPNVFNKNFQAFNGVQDLQWGDEITLMAEAGTAYRYRVDRVYKVKASETIIDNTRGKATLTIVTCNSFGSKDDRYIVEATLVASNV